MKQEENTFAQEIIPDHILENFHCVQCDKYLTVGPVGVHRQGGNICGRCIYGEREPPRKLFEFYENDFSCPNYEETIPIALFAYATDIQNLFPCINRYEGCRKLLPYTEIRRHEKNCVYKTFSCPICDYEGIGSQLVHHFKRYHQKFFLDKSQMKISLSSSFQRKYLYKNDNFLCFINVSYTENNSGLNIETMHLPASENYKRMRLLYKLKCTRDPNIPEIVFIDDFNCGHRNLSKNVVENVKDLFGGECEILCNFFVSLTHFEPSK